MSEQSMTVYIIDDDEDIRSSLSRSLAKRGLRVQTFDGAESFLANYNAAVRGCIILDQGMPGMTGLELQEHLADLGHTIPIIFITGHAGIPESVKAIKGGAVDFIEKPFRTEVLLQRIGTALATDADRRSLIQKSRQAHTRLNSLTARESEIVEFIVKNPGNATSKEIARALAISPRTVDHHRARILEKLQIKSIVELMELSIAASLHME